jgi:hypothetical protein
MPACIQQHVGQRVPYLPRSLQRTQVIPVRQHRPPPPEHPVHGPSQPRPHGLHPASQGVWPRRFHQHVHVVALDRVLHDAAARAPADLAQRAFELAHEANRAQRRNVLSDTEGDVTGMAGGEALAGEVGHARLRTRPAARAFPTPAPTRREAQSLLLGLTHAYGPGSWFTEVREHRLHQGDALDGNEQRRTAVELRDDVPDWRVVYDGAL